VVSTLRGFAGEVECAAFSPDGKHLAAGLNDGTIALRVVAALRVRGECEGHRGRVGAVAFSPDGSTLASGGEDGIIRLWEVAIGRRWRLSAAAKGAALIGHTGPIWSMAFSPDGRTLISGAGGAAEHGGFLTGVPKSTTYTGEIKTWEVVSGREESGPESVTGWIRSVAISPDGRTSAAATLGESGPSVMLWETETRRVRGMLDPHGAFVHSIAFSPDGGKLAAGCDDGTIRLWNPSNEEERGSLTVLGRDHYFMRPAVQSLAFTPDGMLLAAGLRISGENLQIFDLATGRVRAVLEGQEHEVTSVLFSPSGRLLASGGRGRAIRLWGLAVNSQDKIGP
jgi:WD40 repeat protein